MLALPPAVSPNTRVAEVIADAEKLASGGAPTSPDAVMAPCSRLTTAPGSPEEDPIAAAQVHTNYARAVIDALTDVGEFPDLADPTIASIIEKAVARHAAQPEAAFECIIDNPAAANWRLLPRGNEPARVRVACFRFTPTQADHDREQRANQALDEIPLAIRERKARRHDAHPGRG